MSALAIFGTTKALGERLKQALADASDTGGLFIGPLDDPGAASASLILFLYRIGPNASLRNREHRVASNSPPPAVTVFENSLPLDLHYILTVGRTISGQDEEPLLRTLGFAMRALNANADVTGVDMGNETARVSLEPLSAEDVSRIWTLFPTANYRTSVGYIATPVWIDPDQPNVGGPPVLNQTQWAGERVRGNGYV